MRVSVELRDYLQSISELVPVVTAARALGYDSELFRELDQLVDHRGRISAWGFKHLEVDPRILADQLRAEIIAHNYNNLKLTTEEVHEKVINYNKELLKKIDQEYVTQEIIDAFYAGELHSDIRR